MTLAGRLASLIPLLLISCVLAAMIWFYQAPVWYSGLSVIFAIYGLPLLFFRLHNVFFKVRNSMIDIAARKYSPWWTSHQIQYLYIALPLLEAPLHFIPGLFSVWLRLWGSQIGRRVHWTPRVEVLDRSMLEVGNDVVIGHLTVLCAHAITPSNERLMLLVRKIKIGDGAFIGAESRLGPGSKVEEHQMVKAQSSLYWLGELR